MTKLVPSTAIALTILSGCTSVGQHSALELTAKSCEQLHLEHAANTKRLLEQADRAKREDQNGEKFAEFAFKGLFYFPPSIIVTLPIAMAYPTFAGAESSKLRQLEQRDGAIAQASFAKSCPP